MKSKNRLYKEFFLPGEVEKVILSDLLYLKCTGATLIKKAMLTGQGSQYTKNSEPHEFPTHPNPKSNPPVSALVAQLKNEEKKNYQYKEKM